MLHAGWSAQPDATVKTNGRSGSQKEIALLFSIGPPSLHRTLQEQTPRSLLHPSQTGEPGRRYAPLLAWTPPQLLQPVAGVDGGLVPPGPCSYGAESAPIATLGGTAAASPVELTVAQPRESQGCQLFFWARLAVVVTLWRGREYYASVRIALDGRWDGSGGRRGSLAMAVGKRYLGF